MIVVCTTCERMRDDADGGHHCVECGSPMVRDATAAERLRWFDKRLYFATDEAEHARHLKGAVT
jgi:hypothetical protein